MTDHTPGPWKLIPLEEDFPIFGGSMLGNTRIVGANHVSPGIVFGGLTECAGNAGIIVAAPAMYAALVAIKRRLHFVGMPNEPRRDDGCVDWQKEIAALESALAQVEGRK